MAVKDMLLDLRSAASTYLGASVPIADLAIPKNIPEANRHILESAAAAAGLHRVARLPAAGLMAARANGIGSYFQHTAECYDNDAPPLS